MKITINNIEDIYRAKQKSDKIIKAQGYELIADLFCDASGFGTEDEPALTMDQTTKKMEEILKNDPTVYVWITGVGQFQVFLSVYRKVGKSTSSKLANNTYLIEDGDTRQIILHDTVILEEFKDKGKVTIRCGGWDTMTTRRRINEYLRGARIGVKNYNQFIELDSGTRLDFEEGITIPGYLYIS